MGSLIVVMGTLRQVSKRRDGYEVMKIRIEEGRLEVLNDSDSLGGRNASLRVCWKWILRCDCES
jgi:hypothetical protein